MSDYLRGVRAKVGHDLVLVPSVTGIVRDPDGRVLLVYHADTRVWVAPGGAIDPDETPSDAVVREVWEETALHVEPTGLLGVFGGPEFRVRYANGDESAYVMSVFACRVLGGRLRPDGVETLETRWVAAGELASLPLAPWVRIVVPCARAATRVADVAPANWRPPR